MNRIVAFVLAFGFALSLFAGNVFAGGAIPHIRASEFDALMSQGKPALVQFDATWCPYCKALQPHLQKLAEKRRSELDVFRLDVDEEPDLAAEYDVRGLPTLIIFRDGKVIGRFDGSAGADELSDWVEGVIR